MFETALAEDEIVTAVAFPQPDKAAYVKFANPASRYAIVGVMVAKGPAGVRVAVTGAGPSVLRLADAESRSAERSVGQEGVSTWRDGWSPLDCKHKKTQEEH